MSRNAKADRDAPTDRPFGLATATFVVVSSMVGSGILTTSGYLLIDLRSGTLTLGLWVFGGLIALCGALTLAELAAALPRSGGEYAILLEAYGPRVAFLSGWVTLVLGFAAPIAAAAHAAAAYFLELEAAHAPVADRVFASIMILGLLLLHASDPAQTARFQGFITISKLLVLTALVVAGLWSVQTWALPPSLPTSTSAPPISLVAALSGLVYVSYAYTGWNAAAYLGGEIKNPRRLLPLAILGGTAVVTILYLGLNIVYVMGVSVDELVSLARAKGREAVEPIARIAAENLFGATWAHRISGLVGLVLLGSLSAMMVTGPRVASAMADANQLPRFLGRRTGKGQVPIWATALLAMLALVLLWSGSFETLIIFSGVGLGLFSLLTVSAVYVLRHSRPDLSRPFRVPGYPIVPACYLIATTALVLAAGWEQPLDSARAIGAILAGLPLYEAVRCVQYRNRPS